MRVWGNPWLYPSLFVVLALGCLGFGTAQANVVLLAAGALALVCALFYVPVLRVRSRPAAGAEQHVREGGVVVLWRPGERNCLRLLKSLDPADRDAIYWVNVWADEDGPALLQRTHITGTGRATAEHRDDTVPVALGRRAAFVVADAADRARVADLAAAARDRRRR